MEEGIPNLKLVHVAGNDLDAASLTLVAGDAPSSRQLKKKLKQVEELETKVADGLAPSSEQREKLARKTQLVEELAAVEARL